MGRYEGTSPFQTKFLTWSEATNAGVVRNTKGTAGLTTKPVLAFEFDGLVCDPMHAHKVVDGADVALTNFEIISVTDWIDDFAIYAVDEEGAFVGPAPEGTYAAEATSGPPHPSNNEIWRWNANTSQWYDGRAPEDILDYYKAKKIDELWAYAENRIENESVSVFIGDANTGGEYPFGIDSFTRNALMTALFGVIFEMTPNPREWTPKAWPEPIEVTHQELMTISQYVGLSYDAWMQAYLAHKGNLMKSSNTAYILSYDYLSTGWPDQV